MEESVQSSTTASSPDSHSAGLLDRPADALRYDYSSVDPDDVAVKIANFITPGARVLDVGCGTGSVSEIICNRTGAELVGIEPDPERVARARERGLKVFPGFLTSDFITAHGPFDYAVFADVLEHLAEPAELLTMVKGGLRPGGAVVISVPNVAHWFVRTDLLRGRFDYQDCGIMDATHLRWFTAKTIRELLERLGFQIVAMSCTANAGLPDYYRRAPWRWMPVAVRRRVIARLAKWMPNLFGCQHIIKAVIAPRI